MPFLFTALAAALMLVGEDPGEVDPDWPNVANSTTTVVMGALQLEAGIDAQVHGMARDDDLRVAVPLLLRIGVHRRAELRIGDGDPFRWAHGSPGARQEGEVSLGAKLKLWERERGTKVSLGLQPQLVPVSPRGDERFWALLPGAVLLTSVEPGDWRLDFNVGAKMRASDAGLCCDAEGLLAASFGRSFADERVMLWLEAYSRADLTRADLSELAGDAGLVVKVSRRVALDAAVLAGKVQDATVVALLGGASFRVGPWLRRAR